MPASLQTRQSYRPSDCSALTTTTSSQGTTNSTEQQHVHKRAWLQHVLGPCLVAVPAGAERDDHLKRIQHPDKQGTKPFQSIQAAAVHPQVAIQGPGKGV